MGKGMKQVAGPLRPMPPASMVEQLFLMQFAPAKDVTEWARKTFIDEGGDLHNPEHAHLSGADFEILWATTGFVKQGRRVLGMTEEVTFRCGPWQKGRQEQQMCEWFGRVPDYLITLDAFHCSQCDDADFCALLEHELYHIGQRRDEFNNPCFSEDGRPKLFIRGHDVEEFVGIVRRYGVGNNGPLADLIIAAARKPDVAPIKIAQACGTCLLRAA